MSFIVFAVVMIIVIAKILSKANEEAKKNNGGQGERINEREYRSTREMKPYPHPEYPKPPSARKKAKKAPKQTEMSFSEGECIEEHPNHCAVEHQPDSVYATEISDSENVSFTREQLVNGIIMAEILSKPKCFDRN